jgi:NAD(P)H-flavin reductase
MSDHCTCDNPLVPSTVRVVDIIDETYDVKNFYVTTDSGIPFKVKPGQLCMVSLLPVGEGMFSVTYQAEDHLEFAIRRVGLLTDALHEIEIGQELGVRGPYGNGFPTQQCEGKNMLFIGGGIGLAPLRSFIKHCLNNREQYGKIQILYGARSVADLCFKKELFEAWPAQPDTQVFTTIDRPEEGWDGKVAFVPAYLEEINPNPDNTVAVVCGPPIMITLVLKSMEKLGFRDEQVITTLEGRMKCGIGKCGRCNIGSEYICLDGPVFDLAHLRQLPPEW